MNHFIIPQNDSKIKQNNPAIPSYQLLPKLKRAKSSAYPLCLNLDLLRMEVQVKFY
jgi:hypothetical protein